MHQNKRSEIKKIKFFFDDIRITQNINNIIPQTRAQTHTQTLRGLVLINLYFFGDLFKSIQSSQQFDWFQDK